MIHRMTMGRKNPNKAETAGGKTPETNAKEPGEAWDHWYKKLTYADICTERVTKCPHTIHEVERTEDKLARTEMTKSGMVLKKQTKNSNKKPIALFRNTSAGDLFRFCQICITTTG